MCDTRHNPKVNSMFNDALQQFANDNKGLEMTLSQFMDTVERLDEEGARKLGVLVAKFDNAESVSDSIKTIASIMLGISIVVDVDTHESVRTQRCDRLIKRRNDRQHLSRVLDIRDCDLTNANRLKDYLMDGAIPIIGGQRRCIFVEQGTKLVFYHIHCEYSDQLWNYFVKRRGETRAKVLARYAPSRRYKLGRVRNQAESLQVCKPRNRSINRRYKTFEAAERKHEREFRNIDRRDNRAVKRAGRVSERRSNIDIVLQALGKTRIPSKHMDEVKETRKAIQHSQTRKSVYDKTEAKREGAVRHGVNWLEEREKFKAQIAAKKAARKAEFAKPLTATLGELTSNKG